mmetsp:Transcript_107430/g.256718  ORF Transcript_107430/g.256718 Transcript_107430/m.256718 type:complete len:133 (+) Transcript_107430:856-1254(+)
MTHYGHHQAKHVSQLADIPNSECPVDGVAQLPGTRFCLERGGEEAVYLAEAAEETKAMVSQDGIWMIGPHAEHDRQKDVHVGQPEEVKAPIKGVARHHGQVQRRTPFQEADALQHRDRALLIKDCITPVMKL